MDANDLHYIACHNGVFFLPDALRIALDALIRNGFVYVRQDEDTLAISTTRIEGGQRRVLSGRFRIAMFRDARKLAIVNYNDSLRVMAIR